MDIKDTCPQGRDVPGEGWIAPCDCLENDPRFFCEQCPKKSNEPYFPPMRKIFPEG